MSDIFRETHPDTKRFSWRKPNPRQQARLDFFLISNNLTSNICKSIIEPSYRSDHSIIILSICFNDFKHGKGLWKFNNSLLYDEVYLNTIKSVIKNTKLQQKNFQKL